MIKSNCFENIFYLSPAFYITIFKKSENKYSQVILYLYDENKKILAGKIGIISFSHPYFKCNEILKQCKYSFVNKLLS